MGRFILFSLIILAVLIFLKAEGEKNSKIFILLEAKKVKIKFLELKENNKYLKKNVCKFERQFNLLNEAKKYIYFGERYLSEMSMNISLEQLNNIITQAKNCAIIVKSIQIEIKKISECKEQELLEA